jgi:DNA repair protein RadD
VLNRVCYEAGVYDLIQQGYLSQLTAPGHQLDGATSATGLHVRKGEYVSSEVEDLVNQNGVVEAAVREIVKYSEGRRGLIVFAHSIAHAEHVSAELAGYGVVAPVVHSKLSRGERDHAIAEFTARRVRALVNVNVLSEGFDAPHIDVVAMLRPTKSPGLYYQQVGRGLRLSPGKTDCLVLDFAGNIDEHGPIDKIVVKERTGTGDAPTKTCPECGSLVPIGVMVCEECGRLFEQQEPGEKHPPHAASASESAILSVQNVVPKNYKVARVGFFKHAPRDGRKPTLRADYLCADGSVFKEWWCFDHEGYAREKAIQWWSAIQPTVSGMPVPPPDSVDSAIIALNDVRIRYRTPTAIKVSEYGKYPSIVYHEFAEHGAT